MGRHPGRGTGGSFHSGGLYPGVDHLLAQPPVRLRRQAPAPSLPVPAGSREAAPGNPAGSMPPAGHDLYGRSPRKRQSRPRLHPPGRGSGRRISGEQPPVADPRNAARSLLRLEHPLRFHLRPGAGVSLFGDRRAGRSFRRGRPGAVLPGSLLLPAGQGAGAQGADDRAGEAHPPHAGRKGKERNKSCCWGRGSSRPWRSATPWGWTCLPG